MRAHEIRALVKAIGFTHIKGATGWLSIAEWKDSGSPGFRLVMARISKQVTQ